MSSFETQPNTQKLNGLQLSLLRLLGQNISEKQTLEVRQLLMDYFDTQLKTELETVIKEKGYTENDFRLMLNEKS